MIVAPSPATIIFESGATFVTELTGLCADAGVAVVFVQELPLCDTRRFSTDCGRYRESTTTVIGRRSRLVLRCPLLLVA